MEQRSLLEKKDELVAKTKDKLARSAKMQVWCVALLWTTVMVKMMVMATIAQGQSSTPSFQAKQIGTQKLTTAPEGLPG